MDDARLLPPVEMAHHRYFEHAAEHPFDADAAEPGLRNAWWLAECALAAYADVRLAAPIFEAGALEVVGEGPVIGGGLGGQCYVVAGGGAVIVAFRGTQVVKTAHARSGNLREMVGRVLRDVVTDAQVRLVKWQGRAGGMVHQGFARSFLEMEPELSERVAMARKRHPNARLWITGHSLGGALATLAADRLDEVRGIHVFGSPRVGDAEFAGGVRFPGWRFRHHADAVPWVPVEAMGYRHIDAGKYLDRNAALTEEPGALSMLWDAALGAPEALRQAITALSRGEWAALTPKNLVDHAPLVYAIRVWNAYAEGIPRRQGAEGLNSMNAHGSGDDVLVKMKKPPRYKQ